VRQGAKGDPAPEAAHQGGAAQGVMLADDSRQQCRDLPARMRRRAAPCARAARRAGDAAQAHGA